MRSGFRGILALLLLAGGLAVRAAPGEVWVDGRWNGPANCGGHTWQVDAFPTIHAALKAAAPGGVVTVAPGRYIERLTIVKSVILRGPGAGVNPNAPTAEDPFAANPARGDPAGEAMLLPPDTKLHITEGFLVTIQADRVMIDGFTLDGDNPALKDGVAVNGVDANAAAGIGRKDGHNQEIILTHNILRNFTAAGIYFQNKDGSIPLLQQNIIAYNRIDNLPVNATVFDADEYPPTQCAGISLDQELYQVLGNTVTRAAVGINLRWITQGNPPLMTPEISSNALQCYITGISCGLFSDRHIKGNLCPTSPRAMLSHNRIRIVPEGPTRLIRTGISVMSVEHTSKVLMSDNDLSGGDAGVFVWGSFSFDAGNTVILGGTIRDAKYGVWISNYYDKLPYPVDPTKVILSGVTILNPTVAGIYLDDNARGAVEVSAVIMHDTTFRGGPTGVLVQGECALVVFLPGGAGAANFDGQTKSYITLQGNGSSFPRSIDISAVRFQGKRRGEMTAEEQTALETRLIDQLDDKRLGRLY